MSESEKLKKRVMDQVQAENQLTTARELIETTQAICFRTCIPKPGASMSNSESACVSSCIEKYMAAWNLVNATYLERLRTESAGKGAFR